LAGIPLALLPQGLQHCLQRFAPFGEGLSEAVGLGLSDHLTKIPTLFWRPGLVSSLS